VCCYVAVWDTLDEGATKDNVIPHYFHLGCSGCSHDNAAWCPSAEELFLPQKYNAVHITVANTFLFYKKACKICVYLSQL